MPTLTENNFSPLDGGIIWIAGKQYWCKGLVQRRKVSQTPPPQRTGDIVRSDQQIASEVTWEDLTGGLGVINMDERETPDRFTKSTLDTRVKSQWSLLPKRNPVTPNGNAFDTLGFFAVNNVESGVQYTYIASGTKVKRARTDTTNGRNQCNYYNSNTGIGGSWASSGGTEYALTAAITSDPIAWAGNIFFPLGTKLFRYNVASARFDEVLNSVGAASIPAQFLAIFDEDLYVLQNDGKAYSINTDALSAVLVSRGQIKTFGALTGLIIHRNLAGDPSPIVGTDRGPLVHDYFNSQFLPLGIEFKDRDVNNCRGLTTWDGDLWFGKGFNAHQVVSGARIVRGPNSPGSDGLLRDYQGRIVDLEGSFDNFLIAVSDGGSGANVSQLLSYNKKGWSVLSSNAIDGVDTLVSDSFTRPNTTNSLGATETNNPALGDQPWVLSGSLTFGITNGRANPSGAGGFTNAFATVDSGAANVMARVNIAAIGTNDEGLIVRFTDTSNYIILRTTTTQTVLSKVVAGVTTDLGTFGESGSGVFAIEANGNSLKAYLNGTLIISATDAFNNTATKCGIMANNGGFGTTYFDNFLVCSPNRITNCHYAPPANAALPGMIYFNRGTSLYYIAVHDATDNPNQYIATEYEPAGTLVLPWFDAGLAEVQKTALNFQVRTLDCSSTETVKVYWSVDNGLTWNSGASNPAGFSVTITTDGVTTLWMLPSDASLIGLGYLFYNIRLKFVLASGSSALSPKVVFGKVRHLREFDTLFGFNIVLDLGREQPDGRQPQEAIADMDTLSRSKTLHKVTFQANTTTVEKHLWILQYAGPTGEGDFWGGDAALSMVEVLPAA